MCNPLGQRVENHRHHPTNNNCYDGENNNHHQPQDLSPNSHPHCNVNKQARQEVRDAIEDELYGATPCGTGNLHDNEDWNECNEMDRNINWNVVHSLLQLLELVVPPLPSPSVHDDMLHLNTNSLYTFKEEIDPSGRNLLSKLLSKDPPLSILHAFLTVFPDSLCNNPAAFFTVCRYATKPDMVLRHMMTHLVMKSSCAEKRECPYPWILSRFVSLEGAQALLQAFPEGVLYLPPRTCGLLNKEENKLKNADDYETRLDAGTGISYCLLDYLLISPDMIARRNFDETLWNKFKLILVAAECCGGNSDRTSGISPVRTIVKRILARPDFFDDIKRVQHVMWLLHQLRWSDRWIFEKQNTGEDDFFPLHVALSHKCNASTQEGLVGARELIKVILEAHPSAARHGLHGGRLFPLHMAIANGWPCHDLLLSAFPESIEFSDPNTGLVPFQFAAASIMQFTHGQPAGERCTEAGHSGHSLPCACHDMRLSAAFELLRADPTILRADFGAATSTGCRMDTSSMEIPGSFTERASSHIEGIA